MTNEELDKLRAREAHVQFYEKGGLPRSAQEYRSGKSQAAEVTVIAARLAREGWMPPADPREETAQEIMARTYEMGGFPDTARAWRTEVCHRKGHKAAIAYLASCLPEGFSVADLPDVPE